MIRRDLTAADGPGGGVARWWLINQHDHALMSGEMARQLGGRLIEMPGDRERFVTAVTQHDCGWPLHDDAPTLDGAGRPRDVFESEHETSLRVWQASAERAAAIDPYVGLLVSLHSLSLSLLPSTASGPAAVFELNKFQHRMVELQEELRRVLGFRTDLPLTNGLAETAGDANEKRLVFDFRLLQAMDKLSLAICCTDVPFVQVQPLPTAVGGRMIALSPRRVDVATMRVSPWPFEVPRIALRMPYRELAARRFGDVATFREALAAAPMQWLDLAVVPAR